MPGVAGSAAASTWGPIHDDGQVGPVPRQHDASPAVIRAEFADVAITGQRVHDDDSRSFESLQLVRGADQQAGMVGQGGADGGGLGDVRADHGQILSGHRPGALDGGQAGVEQPPHPVGAGDGQRRVARLAGYSNQVVSDLGEGLPVPAWMGMIRPPCRGTSTTMGSMSIGCSRRSRRHSPRRR